jgi:hypothetical protein
MAVVANPLVLRIFINSTLTSRENGWAERWPLLETNWNIALDICRKMVAARQNVLSSNAYVQWACLGTVAPPYYEQTVVTDTLYPLPQWGPAVFDMQGVLFTETTSAGENAPRLFRAVEGSSITAKQWSYWNMPIPLQPPSLPDDLTTAPKDLLWQNTLATFRQYGATQQPMSDGHHGDGDGYWVEAYAQISYVAVRSRRVGTPWKRVSWEATPYANAPQFSPCGCVVTVNRRSYLIPCRFGENWTLRNIHYYFAKPGATVMEFPTPFCCWDRSKEYTNFSGVGEARKFKRTDWANGTEIGNAPGVIWTGPASYFLGLAPEPPIPTPVFMLPTCDQPYQFAASAIRQQLPEPVEEVPKAPARNQWNPAIVPPPPPPPLVPKQRLPVEEIIFAEEVAPARNQWNPIVSPTPINKVRPIRQLQLGSSEEVFDSPARNQWNPIVSPTPINKVRPIRQLQLGSSEEVYDSAAKNQWNPLRTGAAPPVSTPLVLRQQRPAEDAPSEEVPAKQQWNPRLASAGPIGFRNSTQGQINNPVGTITITKPTVVAGDILVVEFGINGGISAASVTAPAGWTQIGSTIHNSHVTVQAFWALQSVAALGFTFVGGGSQDLTWKCGTFRNVDNVNPIDAVGTGNSNTGSATISVATFNTVTNNALEMFAICDWNSGAFTQASFNIDPTPTSFNASALCYAKAAQATAGATGAFTVSDSGSATGQVLCYQQWALRNAS